MALLFELLLTAALTLLAAFLLATFFAANDPRRQPGRAAAAIAAEEERIIEVDEVKLSDRSAEGWVEVEKAPVVVVKEEAEEHPECSPEPDEEEGAPLKAAPAVRPGAGLEEEVDVGEERCDLPPAAAATATGRGVVVEADPRALAAEAVPRDVPDAVGLLQDVEVKQHDLGAEAAPPSQVITAPPPEKPQVVRVTEVLFPPKPEAVEAEHQYLVSEIAPSAEAADAGMDDSVQAVEVRADELAASIASEGIPDVVLEKKEEQIVEAKDNALAADSVPLAVALNVPLAGQEEPNVQLPVEEAVGTLDEVQSGEDGECDTPQVVDRQEELIPEKELASAKIGDVDTNDEGSSGDKTVAELPVVEVAALQCPSEDDARADMDFGEWVGIERSDVEKRFGAAAAFAASDAGAAALSKLNSDVQLQLQGLLKVAIDGPCYDSTQPLTLRPSSRAKWVAWQKLGDMHPEIAMEKYMNLLSEVIPGWLGNETADTKKNEAGDYSVGTILTMAAESDQHGHRGNEESTGIDEGHVTASPNPEKGQSSNIPAQ